MCLTNSLITFHLGSVSSVSQNVKTMLRSNITLNLTLHPRIPHLKSLLYIIVPCSWLLCNCSALPGVTSSPFITNDLMRASQLLGNVISRVDWPQPAVCDRCKLPFTRASHRQMYCIIVCIVNSSCICVQVVSQIASRSFCLTFYILKLTYFLLLQFLKTENNFILFINIDILLNLLTQF